MIDFLGNLVKYIVVLIFLATLLEMLLPQGEFRRYLRMLVGILLILTILTPLQRIMNIEPYLELPTIFSEQVEGEDLSAILDGGKKMQDSCFSAAIGAYRSHIYQMLEGVLLDNFAQELLQLDLVVEEDPRNNDFGTLRSIYAVTRESKDSDKEKVAEKQEEISISINVFKKEGSPLDENGYENRVADVVYRDKAEKIRSYLANYFQLSSDNVEVKVIP
ncbi:MAG: stage III sporulation protein AF [Dethiobacteria bacterium]